MDALLLIWLATSAWVAFDAHALGARRGLVNGLADMGPAGWFLACLLLWVVAFPLYLASRQRIKGAAAKDNAPMRRR